MYPECVAFLRKTMRVREIVVLVRLSHSHGFAQKRNAFRIHGTASSVSRLTEVTESETYIFTRDKAYIGPYSRNDDPRYRMAYRMRDVKCYSLESFLCAISGDI